MALFENTNTDPATSELTYRQILATPVQVFPTLANTVTSLAVVAGAYAVVTSPTLPAGTYLVGANSSLTSTITFTANDTIVFRIRDAAGALTNYPQCILSGATAVGTGAQAIAGTPTGILILTAPGQIIWDVNVTFTNNTGKTAMVGNAYYQRIA